MRVHLKGTTARLERMHTQLEAEVLDAKLIWDAEKEALHKLETGRQAVPLSARVPIGLVRKLDRARHTARHAEYVYDKACEARNAVRSFMQAGGTEV